LLEHGQQQTAGDGQTDAFGLSRGGETSQALGIEEGGLLELSVEMVAFGAETVVVLGKILKLLTKGGASNGLKDAWSIAVESLARSAGEVRLSGDGSVRTSKDSGGVGDAQGRR
jgi:hypothetical protein